MTLHSMIKNNVASRIHFVFPAEAIWRGPADKEPYPAPMVLLTTSFARSANDAQAYDKVVVPFLDRVIMQFPVAGYPKEPPAPPLSDLLKGWNIVVPSACSVQSRSALRVQCGRCSASNSRASD